ncbi:MAG TPA: site-2 protease family protein [Candidatus Acidoferrum sp.]|nr:site-2 protease family protein [Candidatus Acidoferrum sp.]
MFPQRPDENRARSTVHLLSIFGIPININASWVFIYALITWTLAVGYFPRQLPGLEPVAYWANGLLAALLLFASVLIHELAHSLVAIENGLTVRGITLHLLGGVSQLDDEPPDPRTEFLMAAAGPLASLALALVLSLARIVVDAPWGDAILTYLMYVNVAVGVFNLIPGFPLDGGRLLRAVVWRSTGDFARATATATRVGRGVAVALVVLGTWQAFTGSFLSGLWLVLIGLFLRQAASMSYSHATLASALGGLPVAEVMTRDVVTVPWNASVGDLVQQFWTHHVTSFPVVAGGVVRGIATVHDLDRVPLDAWERTSIQNVMRPLTGSMTIAPTATALDALQQASTNGLGRLAVLDGTRLVGYLSLKDLGHVLALRSLPEPGADRAAVARPVRRAA